MVWRAVSATLLLIASGWAQAPADAADAVPLRSPFASPLRAAVHPIAPIVPGDKAGEQKPAAGAPQPPATPAPAAASGQPAKPSPVEVKAVTGKRDPFISAVSSASANAPCITGGKRCLAVDRITLKGLVRSESGYIAVVVNAASRAYFLRENDPLMNGYVMRITSTGVTFKETGKDRMGKPMTGEVTLTLGEAPGKLGGI